MNEAIAWLARNPVAARLALILVLASGLVAVSTLREEIFPQTDLDRISIEMPYLGAAPEEVETAVVLRIEEAVQGIDGVKETRSLASEGAASVTVDLEPDADAQRVVDEVANNVGAITTFPAETERPIVRRLTTRSHVTDVAISGPLDIFTLKALAERVRDELLAAPEITIVEIVNVPVDEIAIEVSEAALRRHGFTFDHVADAVRRSSVDLPGGAVRTDGGEILLRTIGQAHRREEFENLVLWTRPDGSRLRIRDVATVVDGFAEQDRYARFDGDPAIVIAVLRTGNQSALDIADAVRRYVAAARTRLPDNVSITVWRDQGRVLGDLRSLMLREGALGFMLVFILLTLFVDMRLALWVAVGVAFSILGALALMPGLGVSINVVSLFAFTLVIGIMIDDSIMVGENVRRHQELHGNGLRGSIDGALEIAPPILAAILTTTAAFTPLMFVPGMLGELCRIVPLVGITCVLFSLFEALGILPAHLSGSRPGGTSLLGRLEGLFAGGLRFFVRTCYQPMLDAALRWRYLTAAIGFAALALTGAMLVSGAIGFHFLPSIEDDYVVASVRMPSGAPVAAVASAVERLEASAARLRARLEEETGMDHVRHVSVAIGDQPLATYSNGPLFPGRTVSSSSVGEVAIELAPAETRRYDSERIGTLWREETGAIPEAVAVNFVMSALSPGADVEVQLGGPDVERLRAVAAAVKRRLAAYPGLHSIADSFRPGKEEMKLGIRPAAETLGLTLQDLGRQVRQAFYGEEAQRIQRGRDDVRVMVRYPGDGRRSLGDLENMRIRTPNGGEVPFSHVARVEPGRGFASIERVDRNRTLNVTASVDPAITSAGAVVADLRARVLPVVLADYPDVSYTFKGVQAEQEDTVASLQRGFTLTLLAIFALLAVPLKSYVQPLIIMSAIPFGFAGAVWGHVVMGLDVTMLSVCGMVALTGVVVNDSLVMVDFINRARRVHDELGREVIAVGGVLPDYQRFVSAGLHLAIREAGGYRFRPVVLTTLTTAFGVTPLILERSMQTSFLVPMAVSLASGILFATSVTLILVPVAYMILDDVVQGVRRTFALVVPAEGRLDPQLASKSRSSSRPAADL